MRDIIVFASKFIYKHNSDEYKLYINILKSSYPNLFEFLIGSSKQGHAFFVHPYFTFTVLLGHLYIFFSEAKSTNFFTSHPNINYILVWVLFF